VLVEGRRHTISEMATSMIANLKARKLFSVIAPLWNEEEGVAQLHEKLNRLRRQLESEADLEFILVDDGSSDRTHVKLLSLFGDDPLARILVHPKNRGLGAAMRTGFENANGEIICTIDADCSYEPEGLLRLIKTLEQTGADIVTASPYHPEGRVEGVAGWRIVLSKGCSWFYRWISGARLYTFTSVFRAYRARVIRELKFEADGFLSAAEIAIRAAQQGLVIAEAPMTLRARSVGTSKMKIVRTIASHLGLMRSLVMQKLHSPDAGPMGVTTVTRPAWPKSEV
jgi:dolichol-phosphate mannosyltransferase